MSSSCSRPYGLYNGGATCWLNATYQALTSIEHLMSAIHTQTCATSRTSAAQTMIILRAITSSLFRMQYNGQQPSADDFRDDINFARIVAAIRARHDPAQYYDGSFACSIDLVDKKSDAFFAQYPLAHFALDARDDPLAGLYLFGALVIHCALTGARPVPEYRTIGEVSPAMIDVIIDALCLEQRLGQRMDGARLDIANMFAIESRATSVCAQHLAQLLRDDQRRQNDLREKIKSRFISITPSDNVREFIEGVRASIDLSEGPCDYCTPARESRPDAHNNSACSEITIRAKLPRVLSIITDDHVARCLTNSTSTNVYRRSPIGAIAVPRAFALKLAHPHGGSFVTYELVAQIIQEGGHFVALVARDSTSQIYISDTCVANQPRSEYSPGSVALFYVACDESPSATPSQTSSRLTFADEHYLVSHADADLVCVARAYVRMNGRNKYDCIMSACGQSRHQLIECVSSDSRQYAIPDSPYSIDDARDLYASMIRTQVALMTRANRRRAYDENISRDVGQLLARLFDENIGAHDAIMQLRAFECRGSTSQHAVFPSRHPQAQHALPSCSQAQHALPSTRTVAETHAVAVTSPRPIVAQHNRPESNPRANMPIFPSRRGATLPIFQ